MQGLIVFAVFMLLWKGLDTSYSIYSLFLQWKLEEGRRSEPEIEVEPEERRREIGFERVPTETMEVEEDE